MLDRIRKHLRKKKVKTNLADMTVGEFNELMNDFEYYTDDIKPSDVRHFYINRLMFTFLVHHLRKTKVIKLSDLDNLVLIDPKDHIPYLFSAYILLDQMNLLQAQKFLEHSLKIDSFHDDDGIEAVEDLIDFLQEQPDEFELNQKLEEIFFLTYVNLPDIEAALNQKIDELIVTGLVFADKGFRFAKDGKFTEAIETFKSAASFLQHIRYGIEVQLAKSCLELDQNILDIAKAGLSIIVNNDYDPVRKNKVVQLLEVIENNGNIQETVNSLFSTKPYLIEDDQFTFGNLDYVINEISESIMENVVRDIDTTDVMQKFNAVTSLKYLGELNEDSIFYWFSKGFSEAVKNLFEKAIESFQTATTFNNNSELNYALSTILPDIKNSQSNFKEFINKIKNSESISSFLDSYINKEEMTEHLKKITPSEWLIFKSKGFTREEALKFVNSNTKEQIRDFLGS
ncbi:MAG: hypothetical protein ACXAC7_00320 [Candidatus Hodarchaeales archaeon]|jgi:tetratricopeptide (TPR) repeat protein